MGELVDEKLREIDRLPVCSGVGPDEAYPLATGSSAGVFDRKVEDAIDHQVEESRQLWTAATDDIQSGLGDRDTPIAVSNALERYGRLDGVVRQRADLVCIAIDG